MPQIPFKAGETIDFIPDPKTGHIYQLGFFDKLQRMYIRDLIHKHRDNEFVIAYACVRQGLKGWVGPAAGFRTVISSIAGVGQRMVADDETLEAIDDLLMIDLGLKLYNQNFLSEQDEKNSESPSSPTPVSIPKPDDSGATSLSLNIKTQDQPPLETRS